MCVHIDNYVRLRVAVQVATQDDVARGAQTRAQNPHAHGGLQAAGRPEARILREDRMYSKNIDDVK